MKTYLKLVAWVVSAVVCLRIVGPMLVSSNSDEGVIAGFALVFVFVGAVVYSVVRSLKNEEVKNEDAE